MNEQKQGPLAADMKRYIGPRPHGMRTVVRVGPLEETLKEFRSEIGKSLSVWYAHAVLPVHKDIAVRLAHLEYMALPWWKRLLIRVANSKLGHWFTTKFGEKPQDTEEEPQEESETGSALAEEEQVRTCPKCGERFKVHGNHRICPVCRIKVQQ